ncbi:FAD-dependent monooxygenase [Nonomuraea sp. NPDC050556]|uniref:FAD-dependent monooxygenase n=1 Tax=Nonomuraea sp. NPDC050556 TaxID=3364369 RepID=UPI00379AB85E
MTLTREVVIAGAGPTGLMLAAELRLAGIDVLVIERDTAPSRNSRAFGLLPRTLEVWEQRGIADRFQGRMLPHADLAADMVDLDFTRLDTRFGQMILAQEQTELILRAWLDELGGEILGGHEVRGFTQDSDGVTISVSGHEDVRAAYLVGCDGARSAVREAAGIAFDGEYTRAGFVMADLENPGDLGRLPRYERGEGGLLILLPIARDTVRAVVHAYGTAEAPSWEEARELFDLPRGEPVWVSTFGNTARQAASYRRGRVLLAGDAAHVHLPAGGQGLNLGIQDAANLGWKLAAQVRGWAPDGLLDTYEGERHPVAERVLLNTKAQFALMLGGPEVSALRTLLGELLAFPDVNRHLAGQVGGTAIAYAPGAHPLVGTRLPGLRLSPARGLLMAGADGPWSADGWTDRVDTARGEGLGFDCALVRPDGHVAWAASGDPDLAGLAAALGAWFGGPTQGRVPSWFGATKNAGRTGP